MPLGANHHTPHPIGTCKICDCFSRCSIEHDGVGLDAAFSRHSLCRFEHVLSDSPIAFFDLGHSFWVDAGSKQDGRQHVYQFEPKGHGLGPLGCLTHPLETLRGPIDGNKNGLHGGGGPYETESPETSPFPCFTGS